MRIEPTLTRVSVDIQPLLYFNEAMDLDSIDATKRMIERGLGISFLPRNSINKELELGTLATMPLQEGHDVVLPTSVMVRKAVSHGAIVEAFLDLLFRIYPEGNRSAIPSVVS